MGNGSGFSLTTHAYDFMQQKIVEVDAPLMTPPKKKADNNMRFKTTMSHTGVLYDDNLEFCFTQDAKQDSLIIVLNTMVWMNHHKWIY